MSKVTQNSPDYAALKIYLEQRIAVLEEALREIADHGMQLPWAECARIANAALASAQTPEPSHEICWLNKDDTIPPEEWTAWYAKRTEKEQL